MQGKGVMGHCYQVGWCSWRKTPSRSSAEGKSNDFVIIDDDDVIILDFPEYLTQKFKGSGVISIDDDDDAKNVHQRGEAGAGAGDLDNGTYPASNFTQRSTELDDDECQVIQEKCAAFRFSKCKQTFSKKAPSKNRFGLGSASEIGSSENDCSDCQVLEGFSSEVRENWEKAFLRKKHKTRSVSSDFREGASHSNPLYDNNPSVGVENTTKPKAETPFCFTSTTLDAGRENFFTFFPLRNLKFHGTVFNPATQSHHIGLNERFDSGLRSFSTMGNQDLRSNLGFQFRREEFQEDTRANPSFCAEKNSCGPSSWFCKEQKDGQCHSNSCHMDKEQGVDNKMIKRDIINDREKLKETKEYKKAVEAEWEARQQQLRVQAEEAQRLRKRRKAESVRRLEMERRQKQRVEEMRETQKKDEENMNLKEQLRVEVRKELKILETTCIDMASLLRGLGIPVGGGVVPLSQEVHAAYKRAMLKFHPDRASGADIRQQVEAEEKFKLVTRMKEKFLSASRR